MRTPYDVVCLSHLRWDFVYQRPQHLMTRWARQGRVLFVEEPTFGARAPRMDISARQGGVLVARPQLPDGLREREVEPLQKALLEETLATWEIEGFALWYLTPMALGFTQHLSPRAVVYDCMDELSAFKGAPAGLRAREAELFARADVVFTGGYSLYEAKRGKHPNVHPFPSSVDVAHFARARSIEGDPADQAHIPRPRVGFFGVVDERMDLALVEAVARLRPDYHFVLLGPIAKIDPSILPRPANIHWLGPKAYAELPEYLAGWDVAILPFSHNEATRFISPTKTPEYLAAGRPVVSTSIRDVVRPYGEEGLAHIADDPTSFAAAIDAALAEDAVPRQVRADALLAQTSWDRTFAAMKLLVDEAVRSYAARSRRAPLSLTRDPASHADTGAE